MIELTADELKTIRAILWKADQVEVKDEPVEMVVHSNQYHAMLKALRLASNYPLKLGEMIHQATESYLAPGGARVYLAAVIEAWDNYIEQEEGWYNHTTAADNVVEEARQYLVEAK